MYSSIMYVVPHSYYAALYASRLAASRTLAASSRPSAAAPGAAAAVAAAAAMAALSIGFPHATLKLTARTTTPPERTAGRCAAETSWLLSYLHDRELKAYEPNINIHNPRLRRAGMELKQWCPGDPITHVWSTRRRAPLNWQESRRLNHELDALAGDRG